MGRSSGKCHRIVRNFILSGEWYRVKSRPPMADCTNHTYLQIVVNFGIDLFLAKIALHQKNKEVAIK